MPRIVGRATRVVDDADGLSVDEYAGNVGSQDDVMSLAVVRTSRPCSEPWLTLVGYDEWVAILKGRVDFHYCDDHDLHGRDGGGNNDDVDTIHDGVKVVTAVAGDTVFVAKGERFRPVFPEGGTEYVALCMPAFQPGRCLREEDGGINTSEVAAKLADLHLHAAAATAAATKTTRADGTKATAASESTTATDVVVGTSDVGDDDEAVNNPPDVMYHMCERSSWDAAVTSGNAYFPTTFVADGNFTHATAVPTRLLETANHFYKSSTDDWICLQLSANVLRNRCGIITKWDDGPKPVGETPVADDWTAQPSLRWVFPHIYGGIPVAVDGVVTAIYPMERDTDGTFLSVVGLT